MIYALNFQIESIEYSSIYEQEFSTNIEKLKELKEEWENEIDDLYDEVMETYNGYCVIEKPYCEIIEINIQ
jgi:hypothetical protein